MKVGDRPPEAAEAVRKRLRFAGRMIDDGRVADAHRIIMNTNADAAERRESLTPSQLKRWVAYNAALRVKLHGGRVVR